MKQFLTIIITLALLLTGCSATDPVIEAADKVFELARTQYALMDSALGEGEFPRRTDREGNLRTSDVGWWCSGFYPGTCWYTYLLSGDERMKELAIRQTRKLHDLSKVYANHDIGFQVMCSYRV